MTVERLSIELTNRCNKGCAFCYNQSGPDGATSWSVDEVVEFVEDCAADGTRAVSFGGGEPLQYPGVFEVLERLRGTLFRSLTTNGLLLRGDVPKRLLASAPDKVHVSIHFPEQPEEVLRVVEQVHGLAALGITSGVNLVVARSKLEVTARAAAVLRAAGIDNDRIAYLPMRGRDTPTPDEVGRVAGSAEFQSMSCLMGCGSSPRFCSIGHDKTVAWCSYTTERRPLTELSAAGLREALAGLGLTYCGEAA